METLRGNSVPVSLKMRYSNRQDACSTNIEEGMIESKAVPCPYNIILGRDTALPSPNFYQRSTVNSQQSTVNYLILFT